MILGSAAVLVADWNAPGVETPPDVPTCTIVAVNVNGPGQLQLLSLLPAPTASKGDT